MTKLESNVARVCGPIRRGRPTKECSPLLKALRAACADKPNHMLNRRECRPKKTGGRPKTKMAGAPRAPRKPKANKPMSLKAMMDRMNWGESQPNAPPGSPRTPSRRKPSTPKSPVRRQSPGVYQCMDLRYTAAEKKQLKSGTKNVKNGLKARCNTLKDSQGRRCRVAVKSGYCKYS